MKYSVVIPTFNEQEVLAMSYKRLKSVMDELGEYELIFVDDGSRDDSLSILKKMAAADNNVKIISFSRNFGHQEAVSAGMAKTIGNAVIIIDCDLQDPPEVIPQMVKMWQDGADIVYGRRTKRNGETAFKKLTAWVYYKVLRRLGGQSIPANTGDFRLIDKKVCDTLNAMPEQNRFLRGMSAWSGFNAVPFLYERDERAAGQTKYTTRKMLKLAGDGVASFSNAPLRLPLYFGLTTCFLSFAYLIVAVILSATSVLAFSHVLFALVFLLVSALFICLGIFGLYLGRIYDEVKKRPIYIIDEQINFKQEKNT